MHQQSHSPFASRGHGRKGMYVVVGSVLCLSALALLGRHEDPQPTRAVAGAPAPREGRSEAPPSSGLAPTGALDAAAELQIERLSRLSREELVTVAQRPSGFSRLLAMNVLWARGERAAVEQVAAASGDPALVAKARAMANRTAGH